MQLLIAGSQDPCEKLCEKDFPKSAKIGKNRKTCRKLNYINSIAYKNLRKLGNPG
jgi:hypothetical protein